MRKTICLLLALLLCLAASAMADMAVVSGGKLHLREHASTGSEILNTYDSGTQVQVLDASNGWSRVEMADGQQGYMLSQYLVMSRAGIVENGDSFVNLRSAPSRSAKVLGEYNTGTPVTVLSAVTAGWDYVDIGGVQGYMASSFIAIQDEAPAPAATPVTGDTANPYHMEHSGEDFVVQQAGTPTSEVYADAYLAYTVYYPELNLPQADEAIRAWIDDTLAQMRTLAQDVQESTPLELTVQYDTYLVDGRYVGLLETGFADGPMMAHPWELCLALNVDTESGALLTWREIFQPDHTAQVLSLLENALSALPDNPLDSLTVDETWLEYAVLTPSSVDIILPRGEYLASVWGSQRIPLPYGQLAQQGLLALSIAGQSAQDASVATAGDAPQPSASAIDPSRPMIALTFDDGPSDYTLHILSLLEANGARATFCMVGNRIQNYADVVAQVAAQGSEIATHTWSHKKLTTLSDAAIRSQLERSIEAIEAITGQPVTVLRPPYGNVNTQVKAICRAMGLTIATWSVDTEDWKTNNADATYHAIMKDVKNGSIILCHDVKHSTSIAMERVIPELVERGYQLVTVSELLQFSKTGGAAGVVYSHLDTD